MAGDSRYQNMPRKLAQRLVEMARKSPNMEICGFIYSDWTIGSVRNISAKYWSSFHMHPKDKTRALAKGDPIGIYHSHPKLSDEPSKTDLKGWPHSGGEYCRYWIIAGDKVIEWTTSDGKEVRKVSIARIRPEKGLAQSAAEDRQEI